MKTSYGYQFQFSHRGRLSYATISDEALKEKFGGHPESLESAYAVNADEINRKAREILDRNEFRSPFLLTAQDF